MELITLPNVREQAGRMPSDQMYGKANVKTDADAIAWATQYGVSTVWWIESSKTAFIRVDEIARGGVAS